ncbi:MAG: TetR/AcrR family transcriptional regulator, partial [Sulfitobacter sp.]|nr:TetR/AcrR family transcriptional regulator [Sulfitobacter sp.]
IVASGIRIAGLSQSDRRESPMVYRPLLLDFCVGGVLRALEPKC